MYFDIDMVKCDNTDCNPKDLCFDIDWDWINYCKDGYYFTIEVVCNGCGTKRIFKDDYYDGFRKVVG